MRIIPGANNSGQCNGAAIVKERNLGGRGIEGIPMGWLRGNQRRLGSPEEHATHQSRSGVGLSYPPRELPSPTSDGPRGCAETPGLRGNFLDPARPLPGQPRITRSRSHGPSGVAQTPGEWKGPSPADDVTAQVPRTLAARVSRGRGKGRGGAYREGRGPRARLGSAPVTQSDPVK